MNITVSPTAILQESTDSESWSVYCRTRWFKQVRKKRPGLQLRGSFTFPRNRIQVVVFNLGWNNIEKVIHVFYEVWGPFSTLGNKGKVSLLGCFLTVSRTSLSYVCICAFFYSNTDSKLWILSGHVGKKFTVLKKSLKVEDRQISLNQS